MTSRKRAEREGREMRKPQGENKEKENFRIRFADRGEK